MRTIDVLQGGAAWHAARATRFCASEAAAAMGVSKFMTRTALLKQKATGIADEVSANTQRLFDAGHKSEAAARPIAEAIAGVEFFPAVGILDFEGLPLLASFDGIDMLEEFIWENKLRNIDLINQVSDCKLEPHYWAQLEHQLLISGAGKALFTVSDGTESGTEYMWYASMPERRAQLIAAWKQFAEDLAAYVPTEATAPVMATPQLQLPAVSIQVNGSIALIDNLDLFGVALKAYVAGINKKPETDQDFVDLEASVRALKDAEDALEAAESNALAQTASIDTMRRTVELYTDLARTNRLLVEKLVKVEKENRRNKVLTDAQTAFRDHVANLNTRLGGQYMPVIAPQFAEAMKGLKSLDSMRDKVATELARGKIAANEIADRISANLETKGLHGYSFLFADIAMLCLKPTEDFQNTVTARITAHEANEAARLEAERERIRAEEVAKLAREKAQADREAMDRLQTQYAGAPATAAQAPIPSEITVVQMPVRYSAPVSASTPPTLKLSTIAERLGFTLTADFLKSLGFEPAATERASKLYHDRDFPLICAALVKHINTVQAQQAA